MLLQIALKGQNKTAQGNALGTYAATRIALKGRNMVNEPFQNRDQGKYTHLGYHRKPKCGALEGQNVVPLQGTGHCQSDPQGDALGCHIRPHWGNSRSINWRLNRTSLFFQESR